MSLTSINPVVGKMLSGVALEEIRSLLGEEAYLRGVKTRHLSDRECEELLNRNQGLESSLVVNPYISAKILEKIYHLHNDDLNKHIYEHPNLTPALFYKLSENGNYQTLEALVRRADCPVEIVNEAGKPRDPRLNMRPPYDQMSKKWRNEPPEAYRHFTRNRVYCAIAQNPNLQKEKMLEIIQAPYLKPRKWLAKRQDLPSDIYRKLLEIDELPVVVNLASNPAIPVSLLKSLEHRRHPKIVAGLLKNPNISVRYVNDKVRHSSLHVRTLVAAHSKLNAESAILLSREGELEVLEALASNTHLPPNILEDLAQKQQDRHLRQIIARNPSAGVETLVYLFRENGGLIAPAVAQNPNCPETLLLEYAKEFPLLYRQLQRLPIKFQIRYLNWLSKQKKAAAEYRAMIEQYAITQLYQVAQLPINILLGHIFSLNDKEILGNKYFLEILFRSLSPVEQVMLINLESTATIKELYSLVKLANKNPEQPELLPPRIEHC
jgi:hypothetical protein